MRIKWVDMYIQLVEQHLALSKCSVKVGRYCHNYYIAPYLVLVIFLPNWMGSFMTAGTLSRLFATLFPASRMDSGGWEMLDKCSLMRRPRNKGAGG